MLAARCKAIDKYKKIHANVDDGVVLSKLVAYTSRLVRKRPTFFNCLVLKIISLCKNMYFTGSFMC